MADAAASALVKIIFEKLADEAFKKYIRSQGLHSELENLGKELSLIQAVLKDASDKEIKDEAVRIWLNDLQHLAYDIDDVLDDVATEAMRHGMIQESGSKVTNLILPTCCTQFSLSHRLSPKLDSITIELQRLYRAKADLGLIVKDEKEKDTNRGNETSLLESNVVGRENEKEKLLNKLLVGESSEEKFSIIPIVGMGGVGKTTLARLLYNDTKVNHHFEVKAWVCVSDDFDVFKISQTIFQDVNKENKDFENLNQLQIALTEKFKDKLFLLVLDDVWTENYDHWEKLVRPFNSGAPGSRIIMTTRKKELLKMLGFHHLDLLESLSSKDALSLFALHALGVDSFDSCPTLRVKGEAIVKKCGTLPLALKAVGRLLRTKPQEKWDDVLNSKIWDSKYVGHLPADWKVIFPALMLSYHDLSANLKRLFAYCSLFPKDFLFNKEELVLLWIAEGFLYQSYATKSLECFGQEDFEVLLSRSFFQHAPNDESLYVMHDLMNDLATFVAGDCFLRLEDHTELGKEALPKYRHMSFVHERYEAYKKFESFNRAKSLRTLLGVVSADQNEYIHYVSSKILFNLLPRLQQLRVLSLSGVRTREVPDVIGTLMHLRYLNISHNDIQHLPENIGNLFNLQILIVSFCQFLQKLPKSFLKLKNLRHFDLRGTPFLLKLPLGIGQLKSLQTLTKIVIGDGGFDITELKGLNKLHGELYIEGLCKVPSAMHAHEANLSLKRLTKLELNWGYIVDRFKRVTHEDEVRYKRVTLEEEVLKELKPDSEWLKELAINSYGGTEFPLWVGHPTFHQLVHVSIANCKNCTSLPSLGQLPSLKELFIDEIHKVKSIGSEFTGTNQSIVVAFPSLDILKFTDMMEWEVWSINTEVSMLLSLRELHIGKCPKLIEFSPKTLPSLEILRFSNMLGCKIWPTNDAIFPCLRELYMYNCPKLVEISVVALPLLRVLEINTCDVGVLRSIVRAAPSITKLDISSISGLTYEAWRGVTEHIRAVEKVCISSCNEIRFLWESGEEASKVLANMKKLTIYWCDNLVSLGEKEDEEDVGCSLLSSLTVLGVKYCDNMKHCYCPSSIEHLNIDSCKSLTNVSFFPTTKGGQKLKSLRIDGCEKLKEKMNTSTAMLESIYLGEWTNLKSIMQLGNFIYLSELDIYRCPTIDSFPDIQLPVLSRLNIVGCKSMESLSGLEMTKLTLLKELTIIYCPSMDASCHHGVWPPNLCSLEIGGLKKPISEWGAQSFPTDLVDITLHGEQVSHFSELSHFLPQSLTTLCVYEFDKLKSMSIGLQHLTSLQHLSIKYCPKMKHLPKQLLPSLLSLEIHSCPILTKRCTGRRPHYYPLTYHIPHILILL